MTGLTVTHAVSLGVGLTGMGHRAAGDTEFLFKRKVMAFAAHLPSCVIGQGSLVDETARRRCHLRFAKGALVSPRFLLLCGGGVLCQWVNR